MENWEIDISAVKKEEEISCKSYYKDSDQYSFKDVWKTELMWKENVRVNGFLFIWLFAVIFC